MSRITSGRVLYADATAEAEFTFEVTEGDDYKVIAAEASEAARAKVLELLNGKPAEASEPAKTPTTRKASTKPPTAPKQEAPKEEPKQEAPKEEPKKEAPAADPAAMGEPASGQAISTGGERVDPNAKAADPAGMDVLAPVAPSQITDNHLMAAITRRNAETGNPLSIRTLIGKYVPQDGQHHGAADIQQDKRQAFLLELDKVQKGT